TQHEGMAARGKVALIEAVVDGTLPVTRALRDRLSDCLLCGACQKSCPCSVPTTELFLEARAEVAKKLGLPLFSRTALTGLGSPTLLNLGTWGGALLQKLGALRWAPRVARPPYRSRNLPTGPETGAKMRVAYYAGCMMNFVYADVAEATHRVLVHNGYRVESPKVLCCGMPNRAMGDHEGALRLARHNVDALAGYDAIVTDCGTCGSMLKAYGKLLAGDPEYAEKAAAVSGRVYDVAEFLVKLGYAEPRKKVEARVTYHDSCHMAREQKITAQPRQILRSIPGVTFVEMKDADVCCGGAGSFAFTHPELGRRVGASKAANIAATGAEVVATGCPSCAMQISAALRRAGVSAAPRHPVELLARSYGLMGN
ncbi:MAG: (Fe-S)-binding protein, partial [Symbiobacteriaceae bacterium]